MPRRNRRAVLESGLCLAVAAMLGCDPSGATSTDAGSTDAGSLDAGSTDAATATAPAILSISPADGTTGVTVDTPIVITFSQPMNAPATEAAFESIDIPPAMTVMSWDATGTILTVTPNAGVLAYATAASPTGLLAHSYSLTVTVAATGTNGLTLPAPVSVAFSTLRYIDGQAVSEIESLTGWAGADGTGGYGDQRVGDNATNAQLFGCASYDIGADLPADAMIEAATLTKMAISKLKLGPYPDLGNIVLESITADPVVPSKAGASQLPTAVAHSAALEFSTSPITPPPLDVTSLVAADMAAGRSAQFRTRFLTASDFDAVADSMVFGGGSLTVSYFSH